jgi:hypothetical protein
MSNNDSKDTGEIGREIAPARKLGIMIPGRGRATTFVAGVEAVRKGISAPSDR